MSRFPWRGVGGASLPPEASDALAELVAAGHGLVGALAALPREGLPRPTARRLDEELRGLEAGGPLPEALDRLGLELCAAAAASHGDVPRLEAALRADAQARRAAEEAQRLAFARLRPALLAGASALGLGLFLAFAVVPYQLAGFASEGEPPEVLLKFEAFRARWLLCCGVVLSALVAVPSLLMAVLGRARAVALLHSWRLHLPLLGGQARGAAQARLLEALAAEMPAGVPPSTTLRRVARRERVPELRAALELVARRLEVGDPWTTCLAGTPLDDEVLGGLGGLAARGVTPADGWRAGARRARERGLVSLRRAIVAASLLLLAPGLVLTASLVKAATVSASAAELERVEVEMRDLEDELRGILGNRSR